MLSGRNEYQVKLLGTPCLLLNDAIVEFPTRKTHALCIFLAANGGQRIERSRLSGLLWGNSEMDLARASLRKAISVLSADETTQVLIGKDRANAWFAGDPTRSDLATFNRCIGAGTERAYREALQVWRGEPLVGLELGEPTFDEWVATFRADTIGLTTKLLSNRLALMAGRTTPAGLEIALCELIARIDPSHPEANERLIHLQVGEGQAAAAARQLRSYTAALADLDLPAPRALIAVVASCKADIGTPAEQAERERDRERPVVALIRPRSTRPLPDLFSFAHSEVIHQLTRFRTMRCFERDDGQVPAEGNVLKRIGLTDQLDHDYRLLLWDEPKAQAIYLRCINVRRQDTVSCVRIDYEALADRNRAEAMISASINSLEQDIVNDVSPDRHSAFSRWLEAFKLLSQWSAVSEKQALTILEGLAGEKEGRRLSLVHSTIGSLLMIRRLTVPATESVTNGDLERARRSAINALAIDELEPFNHVIMGWLKVQTHEHDRALVYFDTALKLNPYSSRTLIAAAEANAYCGDIDRAKTLAARALEMSGRHTPTYFSNYLANISYLAGELGECVEHLRRAPENVHSAMLLVAAHQERGDEKAASAARVRFERELRRVEPQVDVDQMSLARWIVSTNMTRHPAARQRLFSSLEQAGVPVGRLG